MTHPPVPRPPRRPGPGAPSPAAAVGSVAPSAAAADSDAAGWGRVDADGTVYVRTGDGERAVGQWPGGDPDEALRLYARRFDGLALEVDLLERRVRTGAIAPDEARSSITKVREQVVAAQAVGDLDRLTARLDALLPLVAQQREQRKAARAARLDAVRTEKETLVVRAEQQAAGEEWRTGADTMRELMEHWKALPRIEKAVDDALWRRFSSARTTYTRRRKQHYAAQHEQRLAAQQDKQTLVEEAETLATSTEWGPTAGRFRELMRRWKRAGPAPYRSEEALWARFRAAQDAFFSARGEATAMADAELDANAEAKRAILADAEALLPVRDLAAARARMRDIGARWESAGKVPRHQMKALEGRMRAVEAAVRGAEEHRWERTNPEARARAEAAVTQLEASLERLRAVAAKARAAGDAASLTEAEQSIATRESWLVEALRARADFS